MIVGHLGVGLAAKAIGPQLGLGLLFGAAMLPDILGCVLELARVPHAGQIAHSLLISVALSVAVAAAWTLWRGRGAGAVLLGLVVFSHWPLDWLVHEADMPLIWPGGIEVGYGLWRQEPLAWEIELGIAAAGLLIYLACARTIWRRRLVVATLTALAAALTVAAATWQNPAQSSAVIAASALAAGGLVVMMLFVIAAQWADGASRQSA